MKKTVYRLYKTTDKINKRKVYIGSGFWFNAKNFNVEQRSYWFCTDYIAHILTDNELNILYIHYAQNRDNDNKWIKVQPISGLLDSNNTYSYNNVLRWLKENRYPLLKEYHTFDKFIADNFADFI